MSEHDGLKVTLEIAKNTILDIVRMAIDKVPEEHQPKVAGLLWQVIADPEIADLLLKTDLPDIDGLRAWLEDKA